MCSNTSNLQYCCTSTTICDRLQGLLTTSVCADSHSTDVYQGLCKNINKIINKMLWVWTIWKQIYRRLFMDNVGISKYCVRIAIKYFGLLSVPVYIVMIRLTVPYQPTLRSLWLTKTIINQFNFNSLLAGKLADVEVWNWWCIKFEKQAEILIDKYYSFVKVIHKVVLDIYWVVVLVKVC